MNTVLQYAAPLYELGHLLPSVQPRRVHTVRAPGYPLYDGWPLHGMGAAPSGAPGVLTATAPVAGTVTTTLISSAATSGALPAAFGSLAGPIGAGVAVLVGVIAGLWAAHNARVKGATQENQAINSAVSTWDAGMKAIFAAANSTDPATNVPGPQAAAEVQSLWSQFWAQMSPYLHAPGVADSSMGGANCGSPTLNPQGPCAGEPGGHKCDNSCTATCCVACQDLYPSMLQAIQVLNSPGGGTVQVCAVASSKYGASSRGGYTLKYTPPTIATTAGGILSSAASLFGGAGGTSWLPLLAIGALALFALRK